MLREDLWRRALARTGRTANPGRPSRRNYARHGDCGFTADEEYEIKILARRLRDGVLTKDCLSRDLVIAREHLSQQLANSNSDSWVVAGLTSEIKVLEHALGLSRGLRSNPSQLQVIGNPRRNNDSSDDESPSHINRAVRLFHGTSNGTLLNKFSVEVDDGSSERRNTDLAYLGNCPAIAWFSKKRGSSEHDVLVEKTHIKFHGFRSMFHGDDQPLLTLRVIPGARHEDNMAALVGGDIERLKNKCDDDGILGFCPIVEYTVEDMPDSMKADDWYVHTFEKNHEPLLRWDDSIRGLVYERNRNFADPDLPADDAVYLVDEWFEEGPKRHVYRSAES